MNIDRRQLDALDSNSKRELLARLLREKAAGAEGTFELSLGQEALFFLNELSPQAVSYNVAFCGRIRAQVDTNRLESAFLKLLERHAALRCTFPPSAGNPIQRVGPVPSSCLEVLDASNWSEEELKMRVNESYRSPFDLAKGPLFRAFLFTRHETDHLLLIAAHHIVFDASSLGSILSDLGILYDQGPSAPLPLPKGSYADFVNWQRKMVDSDSGRQAWEFWRSRLERFLTPVDLPGDRPRPSVQSFRGATHYFELPAGLCQGVRALARAENATPYMVLATAFHVLLCRYSGAPQFPIAMPLSGRGRHEFEDTVGYFINPVVLCTPIDPGAPFRQHLAAMREMVIEAQRYGDFPFPELVKRLQPERDASRSPVCQVMLNLIKATQIGVADALSDARQPIQMQLGSLQMEVLPLDQAEGQFDIDLDLFDTGESMPAALKYSTDMFDQDRIERMTEHFASLLAAAISDPGRRISDLPMLSEAEQVRILEDWNATAKPYPIAPIHRLIEDQVKRNPRATALVFDGRKMSFGELNRRANQLAYYLRGLGIGPDMLVGISVERSFEMVVGLLGILKAGAAYVPIDPGYPADRQAYMIEDSGASVLLTQSRLAEGLKDSGSRLVLLDAEWEKIARCGDENLAGGAGPENLAYVIYTSGSTGKPKGAMNEHRAICNRLLWMQDEYRLTASDRVLQKTPFSFDVSVWEFFWPLMAGAVLVIAVPEGHRDPDYLVRLIRGEAITTMHFVPSMLRSFLDAERAAECTSLKRVICSGEALPFELQERFYAVMDAELHNLYGPTEAAVDVTYWACQRGSVRKLVPIGRPVANTRMYILDASFTPVPAGVAGELYIGGVQVGRGYWGRAELTAERFLADPFCPGGRIYKTGDLARWMPDGNIEYLGRNDFQVKIRGFRIELGEIEARLGEHAAVREAVVIAREDTPGDKRLVAYYTPSSGGDSELESAGAEQFRKHLSEGLPDYMIPSAFVCMEALPLTPNGKLDRKGLPAPEADAYSIRSYEAPQGEMEEKLAAVWAEVLKIDRVGRHDNFFDLGGHSLLAVQLLLRLQRIVPGEILPVRSILQAPTVERFAAWLQSPRGDESQILLRMHQGSSTRPPFFCVTGLGGNPISLRTLALAAPPDLSFYGLQAKGLDGSEPFGSVEEAARCYIDEIRKVQPHGPYYIGGSCFGGLAAYEMARMLKEQGESIGALVLIDTYNPEYISSMTTSQLLSRYASYSIRRAAVHSRRILSLQPGEWLSYMGARLKASFKHTRNLGRAAFTPIAQKPQPGRNLADVAPLNTSTSLRLEEILDRVDRNNQINRSKFVPKPYQGNMVIIRPDERNLMPTEDRLLGWRPFVDGKIETFQVEGSHDAMFQDPAVGRAIFEKIDAALRRSAAIEEERSRSPLINHLAIHKTLENQSA